MSEDTAKIAAAFVKAQAAFGPALKAKDNPFFKSKYADLSSCVEAVSAALHSNGIAFTQQTSECPDGVTVRTVLIHESGQTIDSGWLHVPAVKNDPQAYGSALTYARRYSLMTICGITPEDDDGNSAAAASSATPRMQQAKTPPKKPQPNPEAEKWRKVFSDKSDTARSLANQLKSAVNQKHIDSVMSEANGLHAAGKLTEVELEALDEYSQTRGKGTK